MPRGKEKFMENGLCNICKFCTCSIYSCLLLIQFFNSAYFLLQHSFWEIELMKQMTNLEDNNNIGKIFSDDNNKERKSWACL